MRAARPVRLSVLADRDSTRRKDQAGRPAARRPGQAGSRGRRCLPRAVRWHRGQTGSCLARHRDRRWTSCSRPRRPAMLRRRILIGHNRRRRGRTCRSHCRLGQDPHRPRNNESRNGQPPNGHIRRRDTRCVLNRAGMRRRGPDQTDRFLLRHCSPGTPVYTAKNRLAATGRRQRAVARMILLGVVRPGQQRHRHSACRERTVMARPSECGSVHCGRRDRPSGRAPACGYV